MIEQLVKALIDEKYLSEDEASNKIELAFLNTDENNLLNNQNLNQLNKKTNVERVGDKVFTDSTINESTKKILIEDMVTQQSNVSINTTFNFQENNENEVNMKQTNSVKPLETKLNETFDKEYSEIGNFFNKFLYFF